MLIRFVNVALLACLLIDLVTGLYAIVWTNQPWTMSVHRIAGWAVIFLLPWKAGIVFASLKRGWGRRFDRSWGLLISIGLAFLAGLSLVFGLMWPFRIGPFQWWFYQTIIAWHWILALILLAPLALHVWRRWPKPKHTDFFSRRGALRTLGIAGLGAVGWLAAEVVANGRATPESPRRFTGSRGYGLYQGNNFLLTGELPPEIDIADWRLYIKGAVGNPLELTYEDLLGRERRELEATLDCTLGWYTTQYWQGVPLVSLFAESKVYDTAQVVLLRSVTGYTYPYTMAEAHTILLATHVGGQVLDGGHGYPLRVVIPNRRGWFWVKWLGEVILLSAIPDDIRAG